ncbi:MAG: glycosyltransferase [Alphaproteobacteria bacterium]|nr:glycosyltransferase [Alphaproteobacteria bacterium]
MMHVLHIVIDLEAGGAERSLVNLLAQSTAGSVRHSVLCLRNLGFFADQARATGACVKRLGVGAATAPFDALRLRRDVRDAAPDIVQGWMYYANLAAWAAVAGRRAGRRPRLIWGLRCSDMDFSAYSMKLRAAVRLGALLSASPDAIVANSHAGVVAHRAIGYGNPTFEVVENGFDLARFTPVASFEARAEAKRRLGLSGDDFTCVTVARADPMKDYATLIALAARLPHIRFVAVGAGTEALEGPSNFFGLGRRRDVPDILHAADLLVSASRYGEGMPNAIGEAMASAVPVVATDCGDSRRMLVDAFDGAAPAGVVTPIGDVESLRAAVQSLWADPERGRALGRAGRSRAESRYSVRANVEAWGRIYQRVMWG